jgi:citronellol/citronellal dehydrogenase
MTPKRLDGRTILMSGGSRGIGLAIAVAAAKEGANITILAKTDAPEPRLPGTIHTAAAEVEAAGGQALAVVGDVRDEESVRNAVARTVDRFGGIDIVINNASAIALGSTEGLPMKRFDLMSQIQLRGTYLLSSTSLPHLRKGTNPHILSLSPPLNLSQKWLGAHPAYTLAKYGMSLLTLGWAAEYAEHGVAANCLWPETLIATAAVQNLLGGDAAIERSRTPEIVADAAIEVLVKPSRECTGNTFLDVDVLRDAGITDLSQYGGSGELEYDIFVDPPATSKPLRVEAGAPFGIPASSSDE